MRLVRLRYLVPWLAMISTACAPPVWRRQPDALYQWQGSREQFRIFVKGQAYRVHGVRLAHDSVRTVPYIMPPDCDSCATWFALKDIDSVQVQARDDSDNLSVFTGVIATIACVFTIWAIIALEGMGGT